MVVKHSAISSQGNNASFKHCVPKWFSWQWRHPLTYWPMYGYSNYCPPSSASEERLSSNSDSLSCVCETQSPFADEYIVGPCNVTYASINSSG
mmetsp:Transcript_43572/g.81029  ORF Transcript_43572/g.81029 Transcript_43572/m.81029 type:complete len:93 (-) Transcript_43572:459-737(-)